MKVLVTSDWHLDWVTDGHQRFDEIAKAIDHSLSVATQEAVDLYVFAGDLADPDGHNVHRAQRKAMEVMRTLHDASIGSIWLAGNHDVVEDGWGTTVLSPLAAAKFGSVFEAPGKGEIGGVFVVVLPFTPRSHAYDPAAYVRQVAAKLPAKRRSSSKVLVLGHLSLPGITPGSETADMPRGREVTWPLEELKKWFPNATLLAGHYHKAQEYKGVTVVGSLARLTHGEEANQPSMLLVEV